MTSAEPPPHDEEPGPSRVDAERSRATFWQRLFATVLDAITVSVIMFAVGRAIGIEQPDLRDPEAQVFGANYFLSITVGFIYFALLEGGATGQTFGKKLVGIRVADISTGGPIGLPRAVLRHLGRFVSTIPLLAGYLWMLWDDERQTWHDKFGRAVVVPADPDEA